jgi:hypothetical protein
MNSSQTRRTVGGVLALNALLMIGFAATGLAQIAQPGVSQNLLLWDTQSPVGEKLKPEDRASWKAVPSDLLLLEKDPAKASSDPGYYGREYAFAGDAVVETPRLIAVLGSAKGGVTIYTKQGAAPKDQASESTDWIAGKIVDVAPNDADKGSPTIRRLDVLRNADDEIILKASYSAPGSAQATAIYSFDRSGTVEIKPEGMKHVRLSSPLEYGVVPGFLGDDLIFGALGGATTNRLCLPSENMFLGLLQGEDSELMVTWPKGNQRVSLCFGEEAGKPTMRSIDFDNDGRSFYVTSLAAPGIWHKEALTPDYLEKDVKVQWKRPFPARWKTQLYEEEVKTTFAFRETKGDIWRGVPGSYQYPVWFSGEDAFYHLSKKVPPNGESLIYCLEGRNTPLSVATPADIVKQTLGREAAEPILDAAGRKLRTHHRRGSTGVRRACTCGCTEAIQAFFEAGDEANRKDDIQGMLDDMIFFVHCHVERINEYQAFADALLKTFQQKRQASPELKPFLDALEEIAQQIPQECEVQKENMKPFGYADDLSRKTMALTATNDPNNAKAYAELLKAWRAMGGAQDYVVAKCHMITRNLCQAAGYGCGTLPSAVPLAEEVRARCRQTLRNPDGYEIWADY